VLLHTTISQHDAWQVYIHKTKNSIVFTIN
jgi:hypothetical protein